MIELVFWYACIGAVVASILCILAAQSAYYRPTVLLWVIYVTLWPAILVKYVWNLTRG